MQPKKGFPETIIGREYHGINTSHMLNLQIKVTLGDNFASKSFPVASNLVFNC